MKTVAICYGWAEGDWQARKFVRDLESSNFEITQDLAQADIIFAHSLGCYLIPKQVRARVIVLVGLPCWPDRSLPYSLGLKLLNELRYHRRTQNVLWWLNKVVHNIYYIFARPQYSFYVASRRHSANLPSGKKRKVIMVRPSKDTMSHPNLLKLLHKEGEYDFVEIEGAHDDCWLHPDPYIDLLNHFSES